MKLCNNKSDEEASGRLHGHTMFLQFVNIADGYPFQNQQTYTLYSIPFFKLLNVLT